MKEILEFITGNVLIFDNWMWNIIAGMIFLSISISIAKGITKNKIACFFVALGAFFVLVFVTYLIKWLCIIPWWGWLIAGIILVGIATVFIVSRHRKGKEVKKDDEEEILMS